MNHQKIMLIGASTVAAMLLLVMRLCYLQLMVGSHFSDQSLTTIMRTQVVSSVRGNIVDRNGELLATNRPCFDLYWQGDGSYRLTDKQRTHVSALKAILGQKVAFTDDEIIRAQRFGRHIKLAHDLTMQQISKVSEQCAHTDAISIVKSFARIYPQADNACHIVGYLSSSHPHGASGLEKILHTDLSGCDGYARYITRASGQRVACADHAPAIPGEDVSLTIDMRLQRLAQTLLRSHHGGVCLVMDPFDGALLVMASAPTYDPNIFLAPISSQLWQETIAGPSPFLNRAIYAQYPPASLYKIVTVAAGLEEGIINSHTRRLCTGSLSFCGRDYYCWQRGGHGRIDHVKALARSCNIHCYEIAKNLSIDQLSDYASRFGLGKEVGFLLPEKSGLMPTYQWKLSQKGEHWWQGETLSAAIGQSFLLVTPLQVARMFGAIATGYLVRPHVIAHDEFDFSPLALSAQTLTLIRKGMREAVSSGTAWRLKDLAHFEICAKTGTAQISSSHPSCKGKAQDHGWFAGYASYKGRPPVVIVVLTEHTGASRPALMIAKKFLTGYAQVQDQSLS